MYELQYGGILPGVLHKPSLGYYQNAPIQGTAPKHHKHLFSEENILTHSLVKINKSIKTINLYAEPKHD